MLIKFNRPRILGFQNRLIKPGVNELPASLVEEMQDDDILAAKFESGELEIIEVETVESPKKSLGSIGKLLAASERDAKRLVNETIDMEILTAWLKKEKKIVIRKALKERIAKIKDVKFRNENPPGTGEE